LRGFLCPAQSSFRGQQFPLKLFAFFQHQVCSCTFEPDQELQRHQGAEVFQQLSAQLKERSDSERKNPQPAHRSDPERKNPQPVELQPVHRSDADSPNANSPNANSPEADSQPPERKNTQYQQTQYQQAQHSYPEHVKPFELFALLPLAEYLVLLEIANDLEGKVVDYPVFNS